MKRLSKIFLVAGLILFGLSGFTGCAGEVSGSSDTPSEQGGGAGDGGGNLSDPNHIDEVNVDFTQSTILGSPYTYPEKITGGVTYIDTSLSVSSTVTKGTPVKSSDNVLTVTPQSNGLFVQVNYNATTESKFWKHVSLNVKNITDDISSVEVSELVITGDLKSEFLFMFTEPGKEYKVWLTHMGTETGGEYDGWGSTEENAVVTTSIGGYGRFAAAASNMGIGLDENNADSRVVSIDRMVVRKPSIISNDAPQAIRMRLEKGTRWDDDGEVCDKTVFFQLHGNSFTIAYDSDYHGNWQTNDINELQTFIDGAEELFIRLTYRIDYEGKEYKQDFYWNDDEWISDYKEPSSTSPAIPTHKFPLIKITSETGTNYFVTEPIAHHVKDVAHEWDDVEYLESIPDPWYEKCTVGVEDPDNKFNLEPVDCEVKVRGNWTTSYDKKSLRIKFAKDKETNLCGLNAGTPFKNWVLLAVWKDASFLRDAAGLYLYKTLFSDYYASDCKLVEVEVNGEYMGVYLLAEQQEVKSGRVDITETKKSTGTDIGYFIEFDSYYYSEKENERFEINYGGEIKDYNGNVLKTPQNGYTIKSDINNAAQKDFIMKYMNRLWRICYEAVYNKKYYKFTDNLTLAAYTPEGDTDDKKCENCISAVIDVKSLADMYIFNELVCDPDIYLTSFLMDIDFGEGADRKLRFEAPWDFDSTMGNKRFCTDAASSGVYVGKNDMFAGACQTDVNCEHERIHANPWMVIFIRQGWFQKLVKEEWSKLDLTSEPAGVTSYIDTYSSSNYEEVFNYTRNKWGTAVDNSELCPESKTATATSQKASAEYLKTWLTNRFTAVGSIIEGLTTN